MRKQLERLTNQALVKKRLHKKRRTRANDASLTVVISACRHMCRCVAIQTCVRVRGDLPFARTCGRWRSRCWHMRVRSRAQSCGRPARACTKRETLLVAGEFTQAHARVPPAALARVHKRGYLKRCRSREDRALRGPRRVLGDKVDTHYSTPSSRAAHTQPSVIVDAEGDLCRAHHTIDNAL